MTTKTLPPPPKIERKMTSGDWDQLMEEIRALQRRILERRGGVPVEFDDILDEMRGRTDRRDS